VNYEKSYNDEQLKERVWEREDAERSIHKYIGVLRDALGGKGKSLEERKEIIDTDPYRLLIEPEEIAAGEFAGTQGIEFSDSGVSDLGQSKASADSNPGFTLIVDGMIINSVGELLLRDEETEDIRNDCAASYERSLEDFAFATVYASRLVTGKDFRPSLTAKNQPGQEVAARLGEICEQRAFPIEITDGHLLRGDETRSGIRDDIQRFVKCMEDRRYAHFFRDYMLREGTKHLGIDDRIFQEDIDPGDYKFNVGRPYYQNRRLQDELGSAADVLVSFLPKTPKNSTDQYATNALREFATRNVLSLITIMWEGEEFARKTKALRTPHILRALVGMKRSKDRGGTQQQEIVRDLVVEHTLTTALRRVRERNRHNIVGGLLDLRDDPPFKQIRQLLDDEHLMILEPGPEREKAARRVHQQLKVLLATTSMQPDKFHLAHATAIRSLDGIRSGDYQYELYRVFPELDRTRK
jgi:hypothetical protein